MGRVLRSTFTLLMAILITACGVQKKSKFEFDPEIITVTKENYISGKSFCSRYKSVTAKEHGRFVQVPINYEDPAMGTLEIYAWTLKPFEPNLPSFVYINGGPGQNSHGMRDFMTPPAALVKKGDRPRVDKNWNQIHFDQRGLGCSAPDTFEQYQDHRLYSTLFTVRDLELIRQAFGITRWSLYGISYGTLPATIYAAQFPERVTAAVLEGTVGELTHTHNPKYKSEKLNLIVDKLPDAKIRGLAKLWDDPQYGSFVQAWINWLMYMESGFSKIYDFIDEVVLSETTFDKSELNRIRDQVKKSHYKHPQHPSGIDTQVYHSLFCKELMGDIRNKKIDFNEEKSRFESTSDLTDDRTGEVCESLGITPLEQSLYDISKISVYVPVIYFQGSHDGATHAMGALSHWRKVAKEQSQFVMRARGGHNPLTSMMYLPDNLKHLKSSDIHGSLAAHEIFQLALQGRTLEQKHLDYLNQYVPPTEKWSLLSRSPIGYQQAEEIMRHMKAH